MIGLRIRQLRAGFFDRAVVLQATTAAERRVLSRFGAFVRQRARSSMRPRATPSAPGQPPSVHVGLLRQHLYFAWDAQQRSVVIGPALLNRGSRDTAQVLEYGGSAVRRRWGHPRRVLYAARPFMGPAFAAEEHALPTLWRNALR